MFALHMGVSTTKAEANAPATAPEALSSATSLLTRFQADLADSDLTSAAYYVKHKKDKKEPTFEDLLNTNQKELESFAQKERRNTHF